VEGHDSARRTVGDWGAVHCLRLAGRDERRRDPTAAVLGERSVIGDCSGDRTRDGDHVSPSRSFTIDEATSITIWIDAPPAFATMLLRLRPDRIVPKDFERIMAGPCEPPGGATRRATPG